MKILTIKSINNRGRLLLHRPSAGRTLTAAECRRRVRKGELLTVHKSGFVRTSSCFCLIFYDKNNRVSALRYQDFFVSEIFDEQVYIGCYIVLYRYSM